MNAALDGIRVVETASVAAGPVASRLLAGWGAEVIHVEHPIRGDIARSIRNSSVSSTSMRAGNSISSDIDYGAQEINRNKRGMTLDLFQEHGQKIIYKLLEKADVFLCNFRPREITKFKLEYETLNQLNPRLIYADITGYGRKGPDRDSPGYDHLAFWARSGFIHQLLAPGLKSPLITPTGSGDRTAALALALGIVVALFMRERTGVGQEVDVSLLHTGLFILSPGVSGTLVTKQDLQQVDREDLPNAMATFYPTKDGRWLRLGIVQPDPYWSRFCQAIERQDLEHDPRFDSFEPRIQNHDTLFNILEDVFSSRTLAEWKVRLTEAGLPWAPVQSLPEAVADPQARANGSFISFDHPTHGCMEVVANPVKLSKSAETIRMPAPEFGQHTEEILLEYGYTWEDIEQFKQERVIT